MMLLNPKGNMNLHTHTCFCDGKDEPEEMVKKAIDLGFSVLGFSGHEYSANDEEFCMSRESTRCYREEVLRLKEAYRGQIDIYLGVERDYLGEGDDYPYDYIIGSSHYALAEDGTPVCVDKSEQDMVCDVEKYFGGDYRAYVESYYSLVADVVRKTGCDILGHFDLVTKFNEGCKYFDEEADWYKEAALSALAQVTAAAKELAAAKPLAGMESAAQKPAERKLAIEVNTGAMARGYRSKPYPADFILREIAKSGCPVILGSDCHDKEQLDFGFKELSEFLYTFA